MKKKEKTYIIVEIFAEDGEIFIHRWIGNNIREYVKNQKDFQENIAIFEGNVIKSFDSTIDLSRL